MRNQGWNPPRLLFPLLKVRGRTFQKLGANFFCQKRRMNLKRGVDVEMGEVATFFTTLQFSSVTFTACGESKVSLYYFLDLQSFELAMQDFHPRSHSSLLIKPGIICTFLIHSVSLQKCRLLYLTQFEIHRKVNGQIFFECQCKVFLIIAKFLEKVSEDQL